MNEIMYDHSSLLIVGLLFTLLLGATEVGYRLGLGSSASTTDGTKGQISQIQGSLLGVLALLLGFTFSLSLQRFDSRSEAVIDEANAIGTALLRSELLPASVRDDARSLLDDYLELRVQAGTIPLSEPARRGAVLDESNAILGELWRLATKAAGDDGGPVTTGLYVSALNDMIDAYGTRDAALARHVPEPVLFLMFAAFMLTSCLVGYASGVSGHRTSFATYLLVTLVTCLVFVIIDLDRPRRGLIEVSQQSLIELQESRRAVIR